jgi:hypothetical protein
MADLRETNICIQVIAVIQHHPGHDASTTPLRQAQYVLTHASTGTQGICFLATVVCCGMPASHAVPKSLLHCWRSLLRVVSLLYPRVACPQASRRNLTTRTILSTAWLLVTSWEST